MKPLAIICGTGLEDFPLLTQASEQVINTPYGDASVYTTEYNGRPLIFLPRHQKGHSLPPHLINYQANIYALAKLKAQEVLSFCCVGSLREDWPPGSLALCDQFIDFTWGRAGTFCGEGLVDHVDMTNPYCLNLQEKLKKAAQNAGLKLHEKATYICTQGPRLETAAEIKAFRILGADIVGMTAVPEASLAIEAGLCYNSVAMIVNLAAGMAAEVSMDEIYRLLKLQQNDMQKLLSSFIDLADYQLSCACADHKLKGLNIK